MNPRNQEIARLLQELVDLTKLDEGSAQAFRVRAYEKAATAVRELSRDVAGMSASELQAVEGIGRSTADKIREWLEKGTIDKLERLRAKYPTELLELTRIPGLGPKTVLLLRDRLGISDLDGLRTALSGHKLKELPGLGEKTEQNIARAIERLGLHGKERRTPIAEALPVALDVVAALEDIPGVRRIDYCGSLRRMQETIGDVDVVVASRSAAPVMEAFCSLPFVAQVLAHGDTKSAILTTGGLQVDLRVVAPNEYGAAMLYFTGSKAHNIELRQCALDRGWTLNEYALSVVETEGVVASKTEKAIYEALGLDFIPPPLREGHGEIAAAARGDLPKLVGLGDVKGDLHVHSDWSGDGRSSLDQMVGEAVARGLDYIAITEHGENLAINGLSRERVRAERREIERLRSEYPDLLILHGAELNIAPDGSLDYDHEFLLEFEWCVASVHSSFDLDAAAQTQRVITAMEHPAVNAIGHLTGRMIGRRPGIEIDFDAILDAAARTGTALEINCHLDRLDVPADLLRRARDRDDVVFTISTDSHHVTEYDNLRWGVLTSQRGWVDRRRVVNTWPRKRFLRWAAAKRKP